jgi:hypothetical protein
MRAVLQNHIDRVPIIGHKPKLEELTPLETDGYLTATYPRIDMKFLAWRKEGKPQFALFKPQANMFSLGRHTRLGYNRVVTCDDDLKYWGVPNGMANHYWDIAESLIHKNSTMSIRYSGLMTQRIREEVRAFQKANLNNTRLWVVAEVEPASWVERRVRYEDPLVVISDQPRRG